MPKISDKPFIATYSDTSGEFVGAIAVDLDHGPHHPAKIGVIIAGIVDACAKALVEAGASRGGGALTVETIRGEIMVGMATEVLSPAFPGQVFRANEDDLS
ncbi:MAG: hypothetical protein GY722_10180 [bacterium]|nr:hypothetical protein [bacterium]